MELALPLVALGGLYVVSNQDNKIEISDEISVPEVIENDN